MGTTGYSRLVMFGLLLFLSFVGVIHSAKIWAIMPVVSKSHHIWNSALTNELARRGHHITYFSPDKDSDPLPNVRQVWMENVYEYVHAHFDVEDMVYNQGFFAFSRDFTSYNLVTCQGQLKSKGFQEMKKIAQKESFDLIIIDITFNECLYPLIDELKEIPPIVGVTAYGGSPAVNYLTGNPESLAVKPNTYLQITNNMNFVQRVQNVVAHIYVMWDRLYYFLPEQEELARTHFSNVKNLHGVLDRLSMVMVNYHYSFDPPVPAVPGLQHIGGLHIKPPKPLPKDLQQYLDESKNGVIFFSLGTNVQSSKLALDKRNVLLETFKELSPIRVLWKFEADLPEKPNNVKIEKWLPQNDILGHPNVKVFFSHSGLLSTQEALYHGKPVIGMPFLVDQFININRLVRDGVAEKVDFSTLDKQELLQTIRKVLTNSSYGEKAQSVSRIFKDQPQTPLERAVFWTEYVIRHKGAHHLRSPTLNLAWYQNELFDVYAVILVAPLATLHLCYFLIKKALKLVFGKSKTTKVKRQ